MPLAKSSCLFKQTNDAWSGRVRGSTRSTTATWNVSGHVLLEFQGVEAFYVRRSQGACLAQVVVCYACFMLDRRRPVPHEAFLRLFVPDKPHEHEVPAPILLRSIASLQQLAYLLAAAETSQYTKERFRVSDELRTRATLLCKPPENGSFAVGLRPPPGQLTFNLPSIGETDVLTALEAFLTAIGDGARDLVEEMLPDVGMRLRTLSEARKLAPQPGDRWFLGFSTHRREAVLDSQAIDAIDTWLERIEPEGETTTVTGQMRRVDFAKTCFALRYLPAKKNITCFYRSELEDQILSMRKSLIQVTGKFTLDHKGHPSELTDVFKIAPVDTTPMLLDNVQHGDRVFDFDSTITLDISMDDSQQLYTTAYDPFGIYAYALTRSELIREFAANVAMAWDEYAMCSPHRLSRDAQAIRGLMLQHVSVKGVSARNHA